MTRAADPTHYCSVCAAETPLEQAPCDDGHGADCPEYLCARCATVVVLAAVDDTAARLSA